MKQKLSDLLITTKDGDWGDSSPKEGYVPYFVIRGADFPKVRVGDVSSVPICYLDKGTVKRRTLQSNDIIIETAGGNRGRPTGRTLLITHNILKQFTLPCTCASFSRFLRIDSKKADPGYVFWYLQYLYSRGEMWEYQVQHTGVARFQYTVFANTIEISLPPLPIQHRIAHILSSLDDKIELNRQMKETLEAMARAIFKSWFVDFDPVRVKAEGMQPAGMDSETAALFPDGFEEVDGREVPKGWRVGPLGNVIDLAYGEALKEENRRPGHIPVYGSNGQIGWHNEKLVNGPGIIVGRKGNPGIVTWSATDFFSIDTTFFVVTKKSDLSLFYLYHELQRQDLPSLSADSAVPGLNRNLVYLSSIIIPPIEILNKFGKLMESLDKVIQNNHEESHTLAQIRDVLLPKLMSGDLLIGDTKVS